MAALFEKFALKGVTLKNRIAVSPICRYSAIDGVVNDWHYTHLAGLARGGSSLVIVEATGVSPEGRITPGRKHCSIDRVANDRRPRTKNGEVVPETDVHRGR